MADVDSKIDLDVPVQYLPGVGPVSAKKLAKLGVEKIRDLIYFFPRKYLDYSDISSIGNATNSKIQDTRYKQIPNPKSQIPNGNGQINQLTDNQVTIKARIVGIVNKRTRRRGFTVTEAVVEDGTGTLKVVWFNQPYLSKMMPARREIILHGRVTWDHFNQTYAMESPDWAQKPKIVPVYRETDGVSSYYIAKLVSRITYLVSVILEHLPKEVLDKNGLMGIQEAMLALHLPKNMEELERARRRMAFDELFLISLRGQILKQELKNDLAFPIDSQINELIKSLPYQLTGDQQKAWRDIASDIAQEKPMNRLLNGDVGSGKTVVAAMTAYAAWKNGYSAIYMAPTEILANQHFNSFNKLLSEYKVPIQLITSTTQNQKSKLKDKSVGMTKIKPMIYIGTQALLHLKDPIEKIGLVVVDEQHRFGVSQRQALKELMKGKEVPHFLSMTATPIPRSLQLVLFGELDVSVIEEKPAGRREIKTRVVDEIHRSRAYDFIRAHVKAGRQVFVICPLIEETQNLKSKTQNENLELFEIDRKSVVSEYEKLSKSIFPELRIGMLHGKLKVKEKDAIMTQFANRELDILVSTSVVEVGVDIANASVMMIEDAERFGLAQLHQFRGRVGRAEHQSFCFLFSNSDNPKTIERIKLMETVADGFKLAEFDLKNRGAGDIFGIDQSGFQDIKFATLSDVDLISQASKSAKEVAATDPKLEVFPALKMKLAEFNSSKHFE